MGKMCQGNFAYFGKRMSKINVLGVNIDDVSENEALDIVKSWLKGKGKYYIVTPNPEFLMLAQKDLEFRKILNKADLAIPDGAGLKMSGEIKNTTPGVDLVDKLLVEASNNNWKVGFLGGSSGAAEKIVQKYQLKSVYINSDIKVDLDGRSAPPLSVPQLDILFVAFGQGKQEKWIAQNLSKIPVKIAMGVGGSFDYLSGEVLRAPKILRNLGLEWLFRLITQPWRFKRQLVLIQFVVVLLQKRIISMLH